MVPPVPIALMSDGSSWLALGPTAGENRLMIDLRKTRLPLQPTLPNCSTTPGAQRMIEIQQDRFLSCIPS